MFPGAGSGLQAKTRLAVRGAVGFSQADSEEDGDADSIDGLEGYRDGKFEGTDAKREAAGQVGTDEDVGIFIGSTGYADGPGRVDEVPEVAGYVDRIFRVNRDFGASQPALTPPPANRVNAFRKVTPVIAPALQERSRVSMEALIVGSTETRASKGASGPGPSGSIGMVWVISSASMVTDRVWLANPPPREKVRPFQATAPDFGRNATYWAERDAVIEVTPNGPVVASM